MSVYGNVPNVKINEEHICNSFIIRINIAIHEFRPQTRRHF